MSFSQSYSFSAPPEVVFNSLTDPDRVARWLPPGVSVDKREGDRIVVHANGHDVHMHVSTDADGMRLDGIQDSSGSRASVHVSQTPAGGSRLQVRLEGAPAPRVQPIVDDAVDRLRRDVSDNFNAG